jgi:hypothetical protein
LRKTLFNNLKNPRFNVLDGAARNLHHTISLALRNTFETLSHTPKESGILSFKAPFTRIGFPVATARAEHTRIEVGIEQQCQIGPKIATEVAVQVKDNL